MIEFIYKLCDLLMKIFKTITGFLLTIVIVLTAYAILVGIGALK
jgi:hypothetical protein